MRWKNKYYKDLTLSQFERLTPEDQSKVEAILSHVKPCYNIVHKKRNIKSKHNDIFLYSFGEIIDLKTYAQSGEVEKMLSVFMFRYEKNDYNVYQNAGLVKAITNGLEKINEAEKQLQSGKDKSIWEQAGIKKLEKFGQLGQIMMFESNVLEREQILKLPYATVFTRMLYDKELSEIQTRFQEIKQKQS